MRRGGLRSAGATGLMLLGLCCGRGSVEPQAAVDLYFAALGRDPVRALPVLAPEFHHEHGLYPVTTQEVERRLRGEASRGPDFAPASASVDARRVAWLMVQLKPAYREIAASLRVVREESKAAGSGARVRVRVEPPGAPPFRQTFELRRADSGAPWRITSVRQDGVGPANRRAAAVAWPSPSHEAGSRAGSQETRHRESGP